LFIFPSFIPFSKFDLVNNTLNVDYIDLVDNADGYNESEHHYIKFSVFGVTDVNAIYYIDVYVYE
jgi:hypothetical protein